MNNDEDLDGQYGQRSGRKLSGPSQTRHRFPISVVDSDDSEENYNRRPLTRRSSPHRQRSRTQGSSKRPSNRKRENYDEEDSLPQRHLSRTTKTSQSHHRTDKGRNEARRYDDNPRDRLYDLHDRNSSRRRRPGSSSRNTRLSKRKGSYSDSEFTDDDKAPQRHFSRAKISHASRSSQSHRRGRKRQREPSSSPSDRSYESDRSDSPRHRRYRSPPRDIHRSKRRREYSSDGSNSSDSSDRRRHRSPSRDTHRSGHTGRNPNRERGDKARKYGSFDTLYDAYPRLRGAVNKHLSTIHKSLEASSGWMKDNLPAVTKGRFRELIPKHEPDELLSEQELQDIEDEWDADVQKPFLLGQHEARHLGRPGDPLPKNPRRGERDAFRTLYSLFPRYYGCLFEDFIGPKRHLAYDSGDNLKIFPENHDPIPDPFPSKAFSENLKCLALQPIWMGNPDRLAMCLQYVSILRTDDVRPWKVTICDSETKFFEAWQTVVAMSIPGESIDELYSQVKETLGPQLGFYCALFDKIGESIVEKSASKRHSDNDPYYIQTVDLTILINALEHVTSFGLPIYQNPKFIAAMASAAKVGNDYPPMSKFASARDKAILSTRIEAYKDEKQKRESGNPMADYSSPGPASSYANPFLDEKRAASVDLASRGPVTTVFQEISDSQPISSRSESDQEESIRPLPRKYYSKKRRY